MGQSSFFRPIETPRLNFLGPPTAIGRYWETHNASLPEHAFFTEVRSFLHPFLQGVPCILRVPGYDCQCSFWRHFGNKLREINRRKQKFTDYVFANNGPIDELAARLHAPTVAARSTAASAGGSVQKLDRLIATGCPGSSVLFSPRGEAKRASDPLGEGARRLAPRFLNNAGVLEPYVEHGEQAQRSNGGPITCFDRQVVRNAG